MRKKKRRTGIARTHSASNFDLFDRALAKTSFVNPSPDSEGANLRFEN
jgi:hypothetical protein